LAGKEDTLIKSDIVVNAEQLEKQPGPSENILENFGIEAIDVHPLKQSPGREFIFGKLGIDVRDVQFAKDLY
jgi:hypothetical protein